MGAALIPEEVRYPAYNFKNLFEMPVVFYVLCLYLYVTATVDSGHVISAWVFFVFRSIHSAVHCTVNIVKVRFLAYVIAAMSVWFMLFRVTLDLVRALR